jgi:carboxypeptidase Taq
MNEAYKKLMDHMIDITNLNQAAAVLGWDQQVNMPPGGAAARGSQMATLARMSQEMFNDDKTGKLIEEAADELNGADYDSDKASMVRVLQQDYERSVKVPPEHAATISAAQTEATQIWAKARAENDFKSFEPVLEQMVELSLKTAEYMGYDSNPYDALLDNFERDMKYGEVKAVFDGHKDALIDLVANISKVTERVDNSLLHQPFDVDKQKQFGRDIVTQYGFDFQRGQQAIAVHPFCTSFSVNDVRITTRFNEEFLSPALFGLMHESGHGMYEQGSAASLDGTPLAGGTSSSVHESQSRLWENLVGRSKGFWSGALPKLQETFPQLDGVDLDTFYKAINTVRPSYIRVEADEATYNLHIILRFELENDLINGRVKIADLAKEWNERFEAYFGIAPPTDTEGVLQDIHWSWGLFGYFPTYALGNLLSVQYYNQALKAHPEITDEIVEGKFETLFTWLNENIYKHGRKYTTDELTKRITGEGIQSDDYIAYLQAKFNDVYGL